MKTLWTVKHDPLQLLTCTGDVSLFEQEARNQGEDIVQVECSAPERKRVLDLGWYVDRYRVVLVAGDWERPLETIERSNLAESLAVFRELAARF